MAREQGRQSSIAWPEWLVAAVGAVLVAATVALLTVDLVRDEAGPPLIQLTADTIIPTGASFLVKVKARNFGSETAAGMRVEGTLVDALGAIAERSEVTVDYLPGKSERMLGLFFRRDPTRHHLDLRVTGYQVP